MSGFGRGPQTSLSDSLALFRRQDCTSVLDRRRVGGTLVPRSYPVFKAFLNLGHGPYYYNALSPSNTKE